MIPVDVIDRTAQEPMHEQLRRLLLDAIDRERLRPGDALPGEHRICAQYGVSRTVVRQTLARLEREGRVERRRGKGTFVAAPLTSESLVHTLTGLYDEVERRGGHVHSDVLRHETAAADASVAAALEIPVGASVVVLERLRFVDGEPWSLSTTWMPEAIGAVTLGADLTEASLYQLLAAHGIVATQGTRSAEATVATAEQARRLGVGDGVALLRLRSVGRDAHGVPVEHFVAYHRGDRSRFEFQLGDPTSRATLVRAADGDA